jgi:hypothetical protein
MARAFRYVEKRRGRHVIGYVETMVDGCFPSLEKRIPNLISPFRCSRGSTLTAEQLKDDRRLHKVRQIVERFFGRTKRYLNIVGTVYRGDISFMTEIWPIAVCPTDLHFARHP